MKVFNLCCAAEHRFEGWFASAADYDDQLARGLLRCPVCDSGQVRKLPAAPHLNLSGQTRPGADSSDAARGGKAPVAAAGVPAVPPAGHVPAPEELRVHVLKALHKLVSESEDVGPRFADVARRMHRGEEDERNIRGTTTPDERAALEDEGIEVLSLPWPVRGKESLQ